MHCSVHLFFCGIETEAEPSSASDAHFESTFDLVHQADQIRACCLDNWISARPRLFFLNFQLIVTQIAHPIQSGPRLALDFRLGSNVLHRDIWPGIYQVNLVQKIECELFIATSKLLHDVHRHWQCPTTWKQVCPDKLRCYRRRS